MPHPVRHATKSANILLSTTPDGYIRRWATKHPKPSILRKEHHPLIKCRFFCLDKGVHLIHPGFDATEALATISEITRLVEGMPLAIELAASWVNQMSCRMIADQIKLDL